MYILFEGSNVHGVLQIRQGGYYYYGSLAGGVAGYVSYLWFTGNRIRDGLDWSAPFAAAGMLPWQHGKQHIRSLSRAAGTHTQEEQSC